MMTIVMHGGGGPQPDQHHSSVGVVEIRQRARELQRLRSWVIAEAVRAYTSRPAAASVEVAGDVGLGESRLAQLRADLRLTPEERVKAAEATAQAVPRSGRGRVERVIAFDRYDDYLDFKRRDDLRW